MFRSILLFSLILLMFGGASAGIIKVPDQYATIQVGINAAFPGDTVLVADGTYYENIDFKGKGITVASHFLIDGDTTHVDSTIIDGSQPADPNKGSVVSFVSGEDTMSVLCGFTITGGSGTWRPANSARAGGGIYCYNSGCMIVANKIVNNSATGPRAVGGGLVCQPMGSNAWVVLKDNQIIHNTITANSLDAHGGGLLLNCNARLDSNIIAYNTCIGDPNCAFIDGGGVSCQPGSIYYREIIMENNIVTHNSLHSYSINANPPVASGGGVYITRCKGRLTRNEISYNEIWDYSNIGTSAVGVVVGTSPDSFLIESNIIRNNAYKHGSGDCYGGGLQLWGPGYISVINNLIKGNIATFGGGVVDAINTALFGRMVFVNNTIVNNIATYGGGIYFLNTTAYLMNTIIWGNQGPTNAAIHTYNSTIYVAYSNIQGGWTGTGNINLDPQLDGNCLSNSSPCIGKGIASFDFGGGMMCHCPGTDIAGNPRPDPAGSNPDMGAWESPLATEVMNFIETEIPKSYFLAQNYPNPFNSSTVISYQLPVNSQVELSICNLLGQKIVTLVSEKQPAGIHKLNWDARGLASGVYLYRLEAGEFVQAKKLILMR